VSYRPALFHSVRDEARQTEGGGEAGLLALDLTEGGREGGREGEKGNDESNLFAYLPSLPPSLPPSVPTFSCTKNDSGGAEAKNPEGSAWTCLQISNT